MQRALLIFSEDFPPDLLEPTKKTASVFLDLSRDSLKSNANLYCPIFYPQDVLPQIFKRNRYQIWSIVSGGAYYDVRKVTPEWNARPNIGTRLNSEAESTKP